MPNQPHLTPRQSAKLLRVSLGHVYHLIWAGQLSATREDGRWSVPASAVQQRIKAKEKLGGTSGR